MLGFKERVGEYVKVHKEAESKVPKLIETNDPANVQNREAALGAMIKKLRPAAKEGDIFGVDVPAGARTRGAQGFPRPLRRRSQGAHRRSCRRR